MNRDDRRDPIFMDDADRRCFVETLAEACAKTGWQVHAYVLMPNHLHLVVEPAERTLMVGRVAEQLGMGTRGHLNRLLDRLRKSGRK